MRAQLTADAMASHLRGLGWTVAPPTAGGAELVARRTKILAQVCTHARINLYQLRSATRTEPIYRARRLAIYLLRTELHMSFPAIGKILHRDHTTVLYSWNKANEQTRRGELIRAEAAKALEVQP